MARQQNKYADISIDQPQAVALLERGGICAFPTDTIFGIGARLDRPAAIDALYAIKKRPRSNALIALCPDVDTAQSFVKSPPLAVRLADFWPGALTLVLPVLTGIDIPRSVNAGMGTLGVRIPDHPGALALIKAVGQPLVTSSANISQAQPAMSVADIKAQFSGRLPVLTAELPPSGKESTILKVMGDRAFILRNGAISPDTIERKLGVSVVQ